MARAPQPQSVAPAELTSLPPGIFCPQCAYDLRGSTGARCPECGFALEELRATQSQIPWTHRRQLGRVRTYWRTLWRVTFRSRGFCAEIARPVSYADAQRFRWTTVFVAFGAILAGQLVYWMSVRGAFATVNLDTIEWMLIPINAGILLALAALTGLPTFFFHPRALPVTMQNRAVALCHYTCAPLGWLPLALIPILLGCVPNVITSLTSGRPMDCPSAAYVAPFALALALLLWWLNLVRLAARALRLRFRTLAITALVPPLWLTVGLLIFAGVPLLVFYVSLIFSTWR